MTDLNFTFDVPRGREKFRELIVYVSGKCASDPTFGATKLNKILFYSDIIAYERLGQPLTGLLYFRLERGPAPQQIRPLRRALVNEGAIRIDERVVQGNHTQKRTVALREADLDLFTKSELSVVDQVINDLWGKTASLVSDESHGIAWHSLRNEESIPYEVAFLSDEGATTQDISDARKLNEQYGWGLRI
jgi:hypothetical protein